MEGEGGARSEWKEGGSSVFEPSKRGWLCCFDLHIEGWPSHLYTVGTRKSSVGFISMNW